MDSRRIRSAVGLVAIVLGLGAFAGEKDTGMTVLRPPAPFDSGAMNAMLRADVDKDGVLSRTEVDQYDMSLGRRFAEADADRDGKLTLYEFEKLLEPPETSASRR